jgi:hypothetical protein
MSDGMGVIRSPGRGGRRRICEVAIPVEIESNTVQKTAVRAESGMRASTDSLSGEHDSKNRDAIHPPSF